MNSINTHDLWESGDSYEYFMGRWSKLMAPEFLQWLNLPENLAWLDVGCGTGVLGEAIYQLSNPASNRVLILPKVFLGKACNIKKYGGIAVIIWDYCHKELLI